MSWPGSIWPPEFILAKKFFVVSVSSGWFRRLRGKLSSWTFRRDGFGVTVSAYRFRRTGFGNVKLFFFGKNTLFSLGRTHCSFWKEHILFFGKNKLFSLETTNCSLWHEHNVLSGNNTLLSSARTHCSLWKQ